MLKRIRKNAARVLDLVYPPHCLACFASAESAEEELCAACAPALPRNVNPCPKCASPGMEFSTRDGRCPACRSLTAFFERAVSPFIYKDTAQALVHNLKFHGVRRAALTLGREMADCVKRSFSEITFDVVAPVPPANAEAARRNFNQSELLARGMRNALDLPLETGALTCVRPMHAQFSLTRSARLENVRGAFSVRRPKHIKAKTVLLVDDVFTTGATAAECSRTLIAGGAKSVYVVTATRTAFEDIDRVLAAPPPPTTGEWL